MSHLNGEGTFQTILAALLYSAGWTSERLKLFVGMQGCKGTHSWGPVEGMWYNLMLVVVSVPFPTAWFAFMAFKGCDSQKEATLSFRQVASVAAVCLQNPQRSLLVWKPAPHIIFNPICNALKRKDLTHRLPERRPFLPQSNIIKFTHWWTRDFLSKKEKSQGSF